MQYNFLNSYGWLDTIDTKIKNEIEIILGDVRDKEMILKSLGKKLK